MDAVTGGRGMGRLTVGAAEGPEDDVEGMEDGRAGVNADKKGTGRAGRTGLGFISANSLAVAASAAAASLCLSSQRASKFLSCSTLSSAFFFSAENITPCSSPGRFPVDSFAHKTNPTTHYTQANHASLLPGLLLLQSRNHELDRISRALLNYLNKKLCNSENVKKGSSRDTRRDSKSLSNKKRTAGRETGDAALSRYNRPRETSY